MLVQLQIRNIALIDKLELELTEGFNVLTGETGAGKSIIIDSINAILGSRISKDLIRTGEEKAMIEVIYNGNCLDQILFDLGIEPDEDKSVIISREISILGRNVCRINGKLVPVSILKKVGEKLVDIHGQYDNQSLLRTDSHLELLDLFAGKELTKIKDLFIEERKNYLNIKNKIDGIYSDIGEREKKIDILKYQIEEIEVANLIKNEDQTLLKEKTKLVNSEKIIISLMSSQELLSIGNSQNISIRDMIDKSINHLRNIAGIDEKYDKLIEDVENISYLLEDLNENMRQELENAEFNPTLLDEIQIRIDVINSLKRKYGKSIDEIFEYLEKSKIELNELLNIEENTEILKNRFKASESYLYDLATKIHDERAKNAKFLESKIKAELDDLEIKNADFKVKIEFANEDCDEYKFKETGLDKVEFLISTNKGEPLKPLSKIASGGEMARIMLAIKKILATVDKIETLIFDEIDTGISGIAAQKVGKKLAEISKKHQVICVTHLPQIACLADNHFFIEKVTGNNTLTKVNILDENEKVIEIARLLAGDNSEKTTNLAKEMIRKAKNTNKTNN